MKINYVTTTFSPSMFGEGATAHVRAITHDEAAELVDHNTRILATRAGHERLARTQFPNASEEVGRFAQLRPGVNAIHIHYRGPPVNDDGRLPTGGMVTFYLIETTEYEQAE